MEWNKDTWLPVAGYEGLYEVSNTGTVRSLERKYVDSIGRVVIRKPRVLKPRITKFGYERITLTKGGESKGYYLHRVVASAFVPNPNNYSFINHIDENKTNNDASNLEWCTSMYNANYGTRNQRMRKTLRDTTPVRKPLMAITVDGKKEYYSSAREAERVLNYPHSGISNMLKGRTHTACGRTWEYAGE